MAEKLTTWASMIAPGDGDPRHGLNGYSNLKCRCEVCRDAWKNYCLDLRITRARRLSADPSLRPHGTYGTYLNWGCRCAECRRANSSRARSA